MEFPVMVIGERMQTIKKASTTEIGPTSTLLSILVTVGVRTVVDSSAMVLVGHSDSVAIADIVVPLRRGTSVQGARARAHTHPSVRPFFLSFFLFSPTRLSSQVGFVNVSSVWRHAVTSENLGIDDITKLLHPDVLFARSMIFLPPVSPNDARRWKQSLIGPCQRGKSLFTKSTHFKVKRIIVNSCSDLIPEG